MHRNRIELKISNMFSDRKAAAKMRRLYEKKNWSKAQICREFHINYRTLQKILESPELPTYRMKVPRSKPVIGPFLSIIKEMLTEDIHRKPRDRRTAAQIQRQLQEDYGYTGGKTSIYDAVKKLKSEIILIHKNRRRSPQSSVPKRKSGQQTINGQ